MVSSKRFCHSSISCNLLSIIFSKVETVFEDESIDTFWLSSTMVTWGGGASWPWVRISASSHNLHIKIILHFFITFLSLVTGTLLHCSQTNLEHLMHLTMSTLVELHEDPSNFVMSRTAVRFLELTLRSYKITCQY